MGDTVRVCWVVRLGGTVGGAVGGAVNGTMGSTVGDTRSGHRLAEPELVVAVSCDDPLALPAERLQRASEKWATRNTKNKWAAVESDGGLLNESRVRRGSLEGE